MSDSRLTIVHVAAPGPFGGLESVVALLTAGLTRRGHRVRAALVLDLEPVPHPFEQRLEELGVDTERTFAHKAVKESVFPFARFQGVDVILGPEMKSTGEVMGLAADFPTAFAQYL